MSNILSSILTTSFAASIIRIMVPILFAALAASITEKAGVVNIGLEGTMSLCALIAVTCAWKSGSTFVGILGAMVLGVLLSLMIGFFAFKFKTDIILCGIAVNTLGEGGAVLLLYLLTGSKGDTQTVMGAWNLPRVTIPVLSKIPVIGEIFFTNQSVLTYVAFLCVLLVWILLYKTPLGIRIRAVGENDHAADSVGVGVYKIKYISLVLCGLLCGMAGAYMSMSYMTMFSKGMIAGRGFIALAAQAMGRGEPVGVMLSSLLFGFAQALANYVKGTNLPARLVEALPYVVTILGITIYAISTFNKARKIRARQEKKEQKKAAA